jgi:myo-inositol-1(or 4)-monophosphatase
VTNPLEPLLNFALQLAQQAGDIARQQAGEHRFSVKADGTLVTQTDEAIDRLLSGRIAETYPDHDILSEEQNTVYQGRAEFTWVIDPLDGTTNFGHGLPIWGVSIGLLQQGAPCLGVLAFPMLYDTYFAARGQGAYCNRQLIRSDTHEQLDDKHLFTLCTRTDKRYTIRLPLKRRVFGGAAFHLCKIADGGVLAGIEATPKVWDIAAAAVILSEAGGVIERVDRLPIFPLSPQPCNYSEVQMPLLAAGNPTILQQVRAGVTSK